MVFYSEILKRFNFEEADLQHISIIQDYMLKEEDEFIKDFLDFLSTDVYISRELAENVDKINTAKISSWYKGIVTGKLNSSFSDFINHCNTTIVPKGIFTIENTLTSFNFIRVWMQDKVFEMSDSEWGYKKILDSYTKLLNASVFITMNSYAPNEVSVKSSSKIKSKIVSLAERASLLTHSMLLFFLIVMTFGGVAYFIWSLWDLRAVRPDKLFVTALGSLLVLWVLIELINSEIQMLRGDKFRISIFVGIVLIAFIREVLILTLKQDGGERDFMIIMLGGILILGITYFILAKAETFSKK